MPASGCVAVPEFCTKSLTTNAADDQPLLGITQQFLRPVDRATINKLQSLAGGGGSVNVETQIEIVASTTRALVIQYTLYIFEFRPDGGEKLGLDPLRMCICMQIRDGKVQWNTRAKEGPERGQVEMNMQSQCSELKLQVALVPACATQCKRIEMSEQPGAFKVLGPQKPVTGGQMNRIR